MTLTAIQVQNAKGRAKPYKLHDERGLYLLVRPDGGKYWRFKYRHEGREKLVSVGTFPDTDLKTARQRRDEARKAVEAGSDPSEQRKIERQKREASKNSTFQALADEWLSKQQGRWSELSAKAVKRSLEINVRPYLGTKPITEISKNDVLEVLRRIEGRESVSTAIRVRQRMAEVFRYAIGTDRALRNPVSEIDKTILQKPKRTKHFSVISKQEIPDFLKKLEAYAGEKTTRLALRLLLLTFVRTKELRMAEWQEFDLENAVWVVPAERMKKRKSLVVPLSIQAMALLKELKKETGGGRYLFPARGGRKGFMSENTMLYALYRMGYHSRMTGHGVRALASTLLNEMGFRPDIIERQLAHEEVNVVRAAYNRAEYLDERKKMMQHWADYLDGCFEKQSNIIQGDFGLNRAVA
jgi:integrase